MTWKELVYIILDVLKIHSDDSKFTEDHVVFLLTKYRAFALTSKYSKTLEGVNSKNYQTLKVKLEKAPDKKYADVGTYYISEKEIPTILTISLPEIYRHSFDDLEIVFTNHNRMKYVGHNRFLHNIIYGSISTDNKLWIKGNIDEKFTNELELYAVFANPNEADNFNETSDDILDRKFPTEETLIPSILELVLKDLTNGIYKPSDNANDAQDALSDLAGYLRRNMKSQFQKQIDD